MEALMLTKKAIVVLGIGLLIIPLSAERAAAGYRGAGIAAGIIGAAVGTAIIMQHSRAAAPAPRVHKKSPSHSGSSDVANGNGKDPFASASAPADYARPVSTMKP
jgi:hypothetical protein